MQRRYMCHGCHITLGSGSAVLSMRRHVWCMTEDDVRPLSAKAELTPPLTARKAQNSRLKGLNEKVERLLQVCTVPIPDLRSVRISGSVRYPDTSVCKLTSARDGSAHA